MLGGEMFSRIGYYFIGLLILVILGFWQSYFSKPFTDIDSYTHFHAMTMLLWIGMLIAQAFLIRFKKQTVHRIVGKFSYVLVPILTISLILLAHNQIEFRAGSIPQFRLYILFLQLSLLTIFLIAFGLAIANRHVPARHARYMICTALTQIDPAVARIPLDLPQLPFSYQVLTFALTDLILVVLIISERNNKSARDVFPVMLSVFMVFQLSNLMFTDSVIWSAFAEWFAGLPLT